MRLSIADIKVNSKNRIRKNIGDISPLMKSMAKHGLLQPIILDKSHNLLAGYRRLQAAKKLGWSMIDVEMIMESTKLTRLQIEMDENNLRKDFTYDEIEEGTSLIKKYSKRPFRKKVADFFKKLFKK